MRHILISATAALCLLAPAAQAQQATKVYRSASPITPGTNVRSGNGIALACSAAGTVRLIMDDGSFFDVYALVSTAFIDNIAVTGVNVPGTTATCTVTVLRSF